MLDSLLHTGSTHPNLVWILLPSLLSFAAGLGLGARSNRLLDRVRSDDASAPTE
ncbi:hypothetical protein [Natrialba asiatica]|uniref:Uncharacterized protein n=1 Tax=Natrialba asiatica (strain ATCC 700177 / DSM 12278 / JCM 9576 / FERM P-10747 / NBRC 102637 / 172P1) TaxID=29540 RepID=M0AVE7_NATA1|nr:hypothetical protein [Natrialba asiatica]ELZ02500.1 hypothetical protein C481_07516 [Natrialba asiatica DSM 12278]